MKHQILLIGIIEKDHNRRILSVSNELLYLSDYKNVYDNINGDIICYSNGKKVLIIFDFVYNEINNLNLNNYCFDMIIHSYIEDYDSFNINNLLKKSKVSIVNSDKGDLPSLLESLEDVIVITYGFNNKSTITLSSYNINSHIEMNLCLQRNIIPLFDKEVEPFEFNISLNSVDEGFIYPLLAASTLNLLIGDSILNNKPYKNIRLNSLS